MAKITYNDIPVFIGNKNPFKGNSSKAEWVSKKGNFIDEEAYQVWSYQTLVAEFDFNGNLTYFLDEYRSNTTSKLQNIIIRTCSNAYNEYCKNKGIKPKKVK